VSFSVDAHLGRLALQRLLLEPTQKAHHGHAVALHGLAEARLLGLGLAGPQRRHGRGAEVHHKAGVEGKGEDFLAHLRTEIRGARQPVLQGVAPAVVGSHEHALAFEVGANVGRYFVGVHAEHAVPSLAQQQKCQENGVEFDVGAAQIEQPRNFRQVAHEEMLRHGAPRLLQRFPNGRNFVASALARPLVGLSAHGRLGQGGAVAPKRVERVALKRFEAQTSLAAKQQHLLVGECLGAEAHTSVGGQVFFQKVNNRGRSLFSQFHQFVWPAFELLGRLQKVARIGPQRAGRGSQDGRSGAAREAREPFARLPVRRQVFAAVRVGRGHDDGVETALAEPAAQFARAYIIYMRVGHTEKRRSK